MWHCQSVSVVCVPSLSVVQPLDCWSDPMALVALTLWGSGASRRRQSLPDDLHGCQSCPGDSDHGSGSVSRSRSTSASTRWSVFSFREALLAMSTRWSSTVRASSVRHRHRHRCCSSMPPAHRGARLRPTTLLFALIVVRSSTDGITLPLRVDGLQLELGGRVKPRALCLHCVLPSRPLARIALEWCREFALSMSSSALRHGEVGAGRLAPDGQDGLAP